MKILGKMGLLGILVCGTYAMADSDCSTIREKIARDGFKLKVTLLATNIFDSSDIDFMALEGQIKPNEVGACTDRGHGAGVFIPFSRQFSGAWVAENGAAFRDVVGIITNLNGGPLMVRLTESSNIIKVEALKSLSFYHAVVAAILNKNGYETFESTNSLFVEMFSNIYYNLQVPGNGEVENILGIAGNDGKLYQVMVVSSVLAF